MKGVDLPTIDCSHNDSLSIHVRERTSERFAVAFGSLAIPSENSLIHKCMILRPTTTIPKYCFPFPITGHALPKLISFIIRK